MKFSYLNRMQMILHLLLILLLQSNLQFRLARLMHLIFSFFLFFKFSTVALLYQVALDNASKFAQKFKNYLIRCDQHSVCDVSICAFQIHPNSIEIE